MTFDELKAHRLAGAAATVAHDLRNPLAVIRSTLYLLKSDDPSRERRLEKIGRQVDNCEALIEDILAVAEDRPTERALAGLRELIEGAVEAAGEPEGLVIECPEELAANVEAPRIRRALTNLVANAAACAPGSAIEVRASKSGADLVLEVADRGPGFAPDVIESVFEPFASKRPGGTGLGLTVVDEVARAHGGRATASNRDGGGAVVRMKISDAFE